MAIRRGSDTAEWRCSRWFAASVVPSYLLLLMVRNIVGFEKFVEPVKTTFLLVDVGMNVQIQGRGYIGIAKYNTYCFIVAFALSSCSSEIFCLNLRL